MTRTVITRTFSELYFRLSNSQNNFSTDVEQLLMKEKKNYKFSSFRDITIV